MQNPHHPLTRNQRSAGYALGLCLYLGAVLCMCGQNPSAKQEASLAGPRSVSAAQWQEDLNLFAERFASRQKDFDKLYPKDLFNQQLDSLRKDVPQLSYGEITLRLMKLVASAHVGHTRVAPPPQFRNLPLRFYWFSDGLAVISAAQEYAQALGTHVLSIGTMTPQQLETAVAPYISFENEFWLHQQSPQDMCFAELLHQLNLDDADGRVEVKLSKPGSQPFTLAVMPKIGDMKLLNALDVLPIPAPLYYKHPKSYYWYEYLPESQTLYIQYTRCQNDPKLSFGEFTKQMFAAVDAQLVQRTIVDIRYNGGGNSRIVNPLISALKDRPKISGRGHLYVLIGRATFSSGLLAALDFRDKLHAILVGEPLGEKPNSYGEVRSFSLPNSGLEIYYSTKFFRTTKDSDPQYLAPDVLVTRSLGDFLAGRDPVLDAAIHHGLQ